MTSEEFSKLSLYDKSQYIWNNGKYIDYREYKEVTLQLYSVGKKFNEIYYVGDDNEMTKIVEVDIEEVMKFYVGNV